MRSYAAGAPYAALLALPCVVAAVTERVRAAALCLRCTPKRAQVVFALLQLLQALLHTIR